MKKLKLYQVNIGFFKENKEDYPRSHGGSIHYYISAETSKKAKEIALKIFEKSGYIYDEIYPKVHLINTPGCISLIKEGRIEFKYISDLQPA